MANVISPVSPITNLEAWLDFSNKEIQDHPGFSQVTSFLMFEPRFLTDGGMDAKHWAHLACSLDDVVKVQESSQSIQAQSDFLARMPSMIPRGAKETSRRFSNFIKNDREPRLMAQAFMGGQPFLGEFMERFENIYTTGNSEGSRLFGYQWACNLVLGGVLIMSQKDSVKIKDDDTLAKLREGLLQVNEDITEFAWDHFNSVFKAINGQPALNKVKKTLAKMNEKIPMPRIVKMW